MSDEAEGMASRHLHLFGTIDEDQVGEVVAGIHDLTADDRQAPVHLHVSTGGGDMVAAMALVDIIQAPYTAPVYTYGWGIVASAGVFILAAGQVRRMGRMAYLMLHDISTSHGAPNSASLQAILEAHLDQERVWWDWLNAACGKELGWWQETVRDCGQVWLTAANAKGHGLVDGVVRAAKG